MPIKKIKKDDDFIVNPSDTLVLTEWLHLWNNGTRILLTPSKGRKVEWQLTDQLGYFIISETNFDSPIEALKDAFGHIYEQD